MSVHRPEELAFSHTFCSLQLGMDSNTTTSNGLTMASSSPELLDGNPREGFYPIAFTDRCFCVLVVKENVKDFFVVVVFPNTPIHQP